MTGAARVFRIAGFSVMTVFGLLAAIFIAGETLTDPGGVEALLLIALWLVPMAVLVVVAALAPGPSRLVLGVLVGLDVAAWVWYVVDADAWRAFMDERGPVLAIAGIALAVPVGVLGLRRPLAAGVILTILAAAPVVALTTGLVTGGGSPQGGGPGSALMTSGGFASLPELLVAVLFFVAAGLGRAGSNSVEHSPRASVS